LISRRFSAATAEVADDLMRAGQAEGWSMAEVTRHHPGQTSELFLLSEIHRTAPQFLLLLNEFPEQLGGLVPPDIPVICWFLEPGCTASLGGAQTGSSAVVLAESPRTARLLCGAGLAGGSPIILPPGADNLAASEEFQASADSRGRDWDVACFADSVDLSAEARGVTLSGLATVWKSLISTLADRADRAEAHSLEQMLDTVAKAGRLRIADQRVRRDLLWRLEFEAAETVLVRHYLGALRKAGFRVRLWGDGWDMDDPLGAVWAGPRPGLAERLGVFAQSPLLLDCCIRERLSRDTLTATLAGVVPLVRGRFAAPGKPAHASAEWPDGCRPGQLELPTYLRAEQLVKIVGELIGQPDRRSRLADAIAAKVRAGHLATHRLCAMARLLADSYAQQP
jgi:hypothetical protein